MPWANAGGSKCGHLRSLNGDQLASTIPSLPSGWLCGWLALLVGQPECFEGDAQLNPSELPALGLGQHLIVVLYHPVEQR